MIRIPNPFAGFPITDGWAEHRARGSLGGVDYGTPVGTPIIAPINGSVSYSTSGGTGGYIISLAMAGTGGYVLQFLHCSSFNGSARNVGAGEVLGYTGGAQGAPGAGSSTGPHVHMHLVSPSGVREDVLPWFGVASSSSNDPQREVQSMLSGQGLYAGPVDGILGPRSWMAIQNWLNRYGFYSGAIDGIPGPNTYRGVQQYAAKNGNYSGPVDGVLGPRSWAGFAQTMKEDTTPVVPKPVPVPPKPSPKPPKPKPQPKPKKLGPAELKLAIAEIKKRLRLSKRELRHEERKKINVDAIKIDNLKSQIVRDEERLASLEKHGY